jgi:hypothetical protein
MNSGGIEHTPAAHRRLGVSTLPGSVPLIEKVPLRFRNIILKNVRNRTDNF